MVPTQQPLPNMPDVLSGDDEDTKNTREVANKYLANLREIAHDRLPNGVECICAYLASEQCVLSLAVAEVNPILTQMNSLSTFKLPYLTALSHLQLTKQDPIFWRRVSKVEDLLVQADSQITNFHYNRMRAFDTACRWCVSHDIPCYRVQRIPQKRKSKKCIPCFAHNRGNCPADVDAGKHLAMLYIHAHLIVH